MIRDGMQILVDGYNLLHALGRMRYLRGSGALQLRREWLAEFLARSLPGLEANITLVFDCSQPRAELSSETVLHGIRLCFVSHPREQADDVIEETLRNLPRPRRVIVVSDDNRLFQAARRCRAVAMKCEQFLDWLEQKPGQRNRHGWPAWVDDLRAKAASRSPANSTPTSARSSRPGAKKQPGEETRQPLSEAEQKRWLEVFGALDDDPSLGRPPYQFDD